MNRMLRNILFLILFFGVLLMGFSIGHRYAKRDMEKGVYKINRVGIGFEDSVDTIQVLGFGNAKDDGAGKIFKWDFPKPARPMKKGKVVPKHKFNLGNYVGDQDYGKEGSNILIGGDTAGLRCYDCTHEDSLYLGFLMGRNDSVMLGLLKMYVDGNTNDTFYVPAPHSESMYSGNIIHTILPEGTFERDKVIIYRKVIIPDDGIQTPDRWQMDSLGRLYYYGHLWQDTLTKKRIK